MSNKDMNEVCNVININEDARDFYHEAHLKAEDSTVQKIFKDYEDLHHNVVVNLQDYVRQNGGDPEAKGTMVGEIQELWGKARAALSPNVDESLITSLEEAEDRCIHSLKDAIADNNLSTATRAALKHQEATLQKSHDYMKLMKENVNAAA